jgi:hypothetical protein
MTTPKLHPCGCAFHRGASAIVPPDCTERTPAERAAYLASLSGPVHTPAPVYVDGAPVPAPIARLRARFAEVDAFRSRVAHAYAHGARPLRRGEG